MNKQTLPPQAYTRETVVEAFNWLQNQSEQIRSSVHSTDALVSLYLRTKRFGDTLESDAPVSSKDFKSNLKNLARGLQQFEDQSPVPSIDPQNAGPSSGEQTTIDFQKAVADKFQSTPSTQPSPQPTIESRGQANEMQMLSPDLLQKLEEIRNEMKSFNQVAASPSPAHKTSPSAHMNSLQTSIDPLALGKGASSPQQLPLGPGRQVNVDDRSWNSILQIQSQLNLSTPEEALKVVLSAGTRKLLKFLEIRD